MSHAKLSTAAALRILMVENNPGDAELARIALSGSGVAFEMRHEDTLSGALDWLYSHSCDVMLLDLGLPDSQGFKTIAAAKGAAPNLPIIVLTSHDDADFSIAALEAGAQDYLIKGDFTGGALLRAIRYGIARKSMEERIHRAEQQLRVIFSVAPEAILVLDEAGRVSLANPAAEHLFARRGHTLSGRSVDEVLSGVSGRLDEAAAANEHLRGEGWGQRGELRFPAEYSLVPMSVRDGQAYLVVAQDVTERRRTEEELKRLAVTDPLTGLSNRRRFEEEGMAELLRFKRFDVPSSLLMIDIDFFKKINDTHGHAGGDRVLTAFSELCRNTLRSTDVAARLGGEEFGVLLSVTPLAGAVEIGERLRVLLGDLVVDGPDGPIRFTVSVGVTTFRPDDQTLDAVVMRPDQALYRAKAGGRNRVEVAEA
jgi:diguanylate cyclase (GGDEF)-like protein/PAS domain S-box-containing protein